MLHVPRFERLDAIAPFTNPFFQQALQSVASRTYDRKYPGLYMRGFIPATNEVHPGAETYRVYSFERGGKAVIAKSYSTAIPPLTLNVKNYDQQIRSLRAAYEYNIQEVRAMALAAQNGQPANLDAQRAAAARYFIEKGIDDIAQLGDSANGLNGFLNHSLVPTYAGTINGTWSGLTLPADSGKILADMTTPAASIVSTTKQVEYPDTLLMSVSMYSIVANNLMSTAGSTTILKHFLDSNPWIKDVQPYYGLTGIGAGGKDRMIFYRKDPEALHLVVPQEFEMFPPQEDHMAYVIDCHARTGGVVFYYPLSALYVDITP
jgi:hypothetical protein